MPENYIRKQTLVSAERYVTQRLREKEAAILGAEERLNREEYRVFSEVRDFVESRTHRIRRPRRQLRYLTCWLPSRKSVANNYCR